MTTENRPDSKWRAVKDMLVLTVTFLIIMAAYGGVLNLQSSINIEEGLGTTSVLIIFVTSAVSCICFIPFLVDYLGPKIALILGEIGCAVYIAGNFYPSWTVLIVCSVVHGILESASFAAVSVFVSYLAQQYWIKVVQESSNPSNKQSLASYTQRAFGYFYATTYFGQIIGNTFSSAVFLIFNEKDDGIANVTYVNSTKEPTTLPSITDTKGFDLNLCGANDCQADYVFNGTAAELSKYQPSITGIYFLITFFLVMVVAGVIVQGIWLPSPPSKYDEKRKDKAAEAIDGESSSLRLNIKQYIFDIAYHVLSPLNLLMITTNFYYGLVYGYNITEYTRAYVSCTVGVEQVGIAMTVMGISCGVSCALFGYIQPRIGTRRFALLMGGLHLATYLVSLLWQPTNNTIWVVYLLAVMYGINESSILCLSEGLTAVYFKNRLGIAFSFKNLVTNLGIATTTGWSTALCVSTKLYIHVGILAVCVINLHISDWQFNKDSQSSTKTEDQIKRNHIVAEETSFLPEYRKQQTSKL